jgi:Gpi18-like mannosyltransferase
MNTRSGILRRPPILFFVFFGLIALVLRWSLFNFESNDYKGCLKPWYEFILQHGRFASLKYEFSNYTPPYLYLLSLSTVLPLSPLHSIKVISLLFEILLAIVSFRVVQLLRSDAHVVRWAPVTVLFLPTVVFNGSLWGQCDVIYTSFLVMALYCVLKNADVLACLAYGVALSVKLQSIFLLPLFIILVLARQMSLAKIPVIPCMYVLLVLPCVAAGRSFKSLLTIYLDQASEYTSLTMNAPNVYQWLGADASPALHQLGIIVSAFLTVLIIIFWLFFGPRRVQRENLLHLALLFALLEPFFLPRMHERYFFAADVLALLYAFCTPSRWYVALWVEAASWLSYFPFLFSEEPVDLGYVAALMAAALMVLLIDLARGATTMGARGSPVLSESKRGHA